MLTNMEGEGEGGEMHQIRQHRFNLHMNVINEIKIEVV